MTAPVGAGCHAAGRAHRRARRTQPREGKARDAARLVYERGVLDRVEYLLHGVLHGQHEARRQLTQRSAGVHERGRIGHELEFGHHVKELTGHGLHIGVGIVIPVSRGYGARHALEHAARRLGELTLLIPGQIAALKHAHRVFVQLYFLHIVISPYISVYIICGSPRPRAALISASTDCADWGAVCVCSLLCARQILPSSLRMGRGLRANIAQWGHVLSRSRHTLRVNVAAS